MTGCLREVSGVLGRFLIVQIAHIVHDLRDEIYYANRADRGIDVEKRLRRDAHFMHTADGNVLRPSGLRCHRLAILLLTRLAAQRCWDAQTVQEDVVQQAGDVPDGCLDLSAPRTVPVRLGPRESTP